MPLVHVPLPCVVYTRQAPGGSYAFSHHCDQSALKLFPCSLRASDLLRHDPKQNWCSLRRASFLVLVAGDVAQGVSVASAGEKARTRFLFHGSSYARPAEKYKQNVLCSEVSENYVMLYFHGTVAVYDKNHRFHTAIPVESGVALFPRHIHESDIPLLTRWAEACISKTLHTSVWVTDQGDSYNEHTFRCSPRMKVMI
jgi:hypothetical protein